MKQILDENDECENDDKKLVDEQCSMDLVKKRKLQNNSECTLMRRPKSNSLMIQIEKSMFEHDFERVLKSIDFIQFQMY